MGRRAEGPRPTWGSPGRRSLWQAVLLTASILSSGFLLTRAQPDAHAFISVDPPRNIREGKDVTLTPRGKIVFLHCSWYRGPDRSSNRILTYMQATGVQDIGPRHTNRETGGPGCTLHIRNVTLSHSGIYTMNKLKDGVYELGTVELEVREADPVEEIILTRGIIGTITGCLVGVAVNVAVLSFAYWGSPFGPGPR